MPDTRGFPVVVEAGPEVLRKAFRGAWKSALCPEDPGDSGRIPENLDVTEAVGMTFGPYSIVDAQVQIPLEELQPKLQAIAKNGYEEQIFVRADTNVSYGSVMEVMGLLNGAGYRKIGLVTGNIEKKAEISN